MRAAAALLLAAGVLCLVGGRAASASPDFDYPAAFNFGDSNSDTGGMAAASGLNIALPEGHTYFRRPTGRLSDGRLVIDFIGNSQIGPFESCLGRVLGSRFD